MGPEDRKNEPEDVKSGVLMNNREFEALQKYVMAHEKLVTTELEMDELHPFFCDEWGDAVRASNELKEVVRELGTQARIRI